MYPISVAARCAGAACVPIVLLLVLARPEWIHPWSKRINSSLTSISKRPVKFAIIVAVSTFLLNAAISCFSFWPIPSVHDEFAYVLTGDTFAHGRLTNPTHPLWEHFASWHVIQTPSYQAKYPPAQGVALALGQVMFGHQLVGVWVSLAIAMAATVWASFQWLPRRWAVYASLLVAFNPHIHLRWGQSYWGGAVALAGGALLIGALGRLRHHPDLVTGLSAGLGLVVLAASRPFEGLLMSIPICTFACWIVVTKFSRQQVTVATVGAVVLATGGLMLAKYNRSVTGDMAKLPYRVWLQQQGDELDRTLTPSLIPVKHESSPPKSLESSNSLKFGAGETPPSGQVRDWRVAEMARMMSERKADAFNFKRRKIWLMLEFYFQGLLWLSLFAVPLVVREKWRAVLFASVAIVLAGSWTHLSAGHAHYFAGAAVGLIIVATMCIRRLESVAIFGQRIGPTFTAAALTCSMGISGLTLVADVIEQPRMPRLRWAHRRQAIERTLSSDSLQDVIFVRYLPGHSIHQEWVYNGANIDEQQVIWANDLGDDANRNLVQYLADQNNPDGRRMPKAWLLVAGADDEELSPYTAILNEPST